MVAHGHGGRQEAALRYLRRIAVSGEEGLETATALDGDALLAGSGYQPGERDLVVRTISKLVDRQPLDSAEAFALEAIIIPDRRPAIDISHGDFSVTHPDWLGFNAPPVHQAITAAIPSVGRIDLPGHPSLPYGGTGFVVGEGLLMTNRHVAELFAEGAGLDQPRLRSGASAAVDFLQEASGGSAPFVVHDVVMIHPYWDMALLKVEFLDGDRPPLLLATKEPEDLPAREVAVIGYPAFDPRNDAAVQNRVFNGRFGIKRLQPGLVGPRWSIGSFGKEVPALTHDSSTLGGCSGAAVFHPATGTVIGVHFGGTYLARNYAVPASELAKDGRVIDAGVTFAGTPRRQSGAWDAWWPARGSAQAAPPPL